MGVVAMPRKQTELPLVIGIAGASLGDPLLQGSDTPEMVTIRLRTLRGDLLRGTQASQQGGLRGRVSSIGAGVQRRLGEQMVRQSAESLMTNMKAALER